MVPAVRRTRNFQGVQVTTYDGQPTKWGEGVRIVFPDGSERVAAPTDSHHDLDEVTCYEVNRWRVAKWKEAGHGGVI